MIKHRKKKLFFYSPSSWKCSYILPISWGYDMGIYNRSWNVARHISNSWEGNKGLHFMNIIRFRSLGWRNV
jgi:hypothetical protein